MKIKIFILLFVATMLAISCNENKTKSNNNENKKNKQQSVYNKESVEIEVVSGKLSGTLLIPEKKDTKIPVVLLIAGSGPTDRNGNNKYMKNNCLKFLAEELYAQNIASLRYDKRGIGKSKFKKFKEKDLMFENYINDAASFIKFLKKDNRFSSIIVAGHSEGSLIGMIAARYASPGKFISLNGAGRSADLLLKEQIGTQPSIKDVAFSIIDSLVAGNEVNNIPPVLESLFRKSVQSYIASWFKYNPQEEIKKLDIPVLIVQGKTDIQVSEKDAKRLKDAKPEAELVLIDGMNHIFKDVEKDRTKNIATYSDANLPVDKTLIKIISDFIKK